MDQTQVYVDEFANEGLRTLLLAAKSLDEEYYREWNCRFQSAQCDVNSKEEKVDLLQDEIEQCMMLIGSTAIEDKLQEEVAETIVSLKEAGIKVWVLTGDKVETAINIGYSAGLLNNDMTQFQITTCDIEEIIAKLKDITEQLEA